MSPVIETAPKSTSEDVYDPAPVICQELGLSAAGVRAVVALLTEGATVPFIARYRKEATGGLDEVAIRNIEDNPRTAPPLKINLLNKAGKVVATQIARPADPRIPPGETRHFAIAMLDPPSSAHDLEVTFAEAPPAAKPKAAPKPKPAAAKPHAAPKAAAHGPAAPPAAPAPAPVEARPLPATSPYALEKHG